MEAMRKRLIHQGMSRSYADLLAAKYIRSLETDGYQVIKMMNLFDTQKDNFNS